MDNLSKRDVLSSVISSGASDSASGFWIPSDVRRDLLWAVNDPDGWKREQARRALERIEYNRLGNRIKRLPRNLWHWASYQARRPYLWYWWRIRTPVKEWLEERRDS